MYLIWSLAGRFSITVESFLPLIGQGSSKSQIDSASTKSENLCTKSEDRLMVEQDDAEDLFEWRDVNGQD